MDVIELSGSSVPTKLFCEVQYFGKQHFNRVWVGKQQMQINTDDYTAFITW